MRSWSSWRAEAEAPELFVFSSWMDDFFDGQGSRENFVKDAVEFFRNRSERRATPPVRVVVSDDE